VHEARQIQQRRAVEGELIVNELVRCFGVDPFAWDVEFGDGFGAIAGAVRVGD